MDPADTTGPDPVGSDPRGQEAVGRLPLEQRSPEEASPNQDAGSRPSRRGSRGPRVVVLVVALALVAGVVYWALRPRVAPASPADLPYATYIATSPFGTGDGALLEGELVRLSGGCIVVTGSDVIIPVFPDRYTAWDAAAGQITLDGATLTIGDTVGFGGSFAEDAPIGAIVPAACRTIDAELFVVSSLAGPVVTMPASSPKGNVIARTRDLPNAPDPVRNTAGRISCGEFVLDQRGEIPAEAVACLAGALGSDVELALTFPTTEGDPIVYFIIGVAQQRQPAPGRALDIYRTSHWDKFGANGERDSWSRATCPASAVNDVESLRTCVLGGDFVQIP